MKISVVCLASRSGGGLKILQDLHEHAQYSKSGHQWQFIVSDQDLGESTKQVKVEKIAPTYSGWKSRLWAEATRGRKIIKSFNPDVVLSLQNTDTLARGKYPLAVYIQQALPFSLSYKASFLNPKERGIAWRQRILKYPILCAVRSASVSFVQTHWLREVIKANCPNAQVKRVGFKVVDSHSLGSERTTRPEGFFYPASAVSYKNHKTLHAAMQILDKRNSNLIGKVMLTVEEGQLRELLDGISDKEISWYECVGWLDFVSTGKQYTKSILVFPSLVESLGLPLYEAKGAGSWVVAADTSFAREALDGYPRVFWFEPTDPLGMANAMTEAWNAAGTTTPSVSYSREEENCWDRMEKELENILRKT